MDIFNLDDEQKKFDQRDKKLKDRDASDFRKLAKQAEFRRFSYKLLKVTGRIGGPASPFDQVHSQMCRKVGRWEVGNALYLLYEQEAPEELAVMKREASSDQLLRETEKRNEEGDSDA